MAEKQNVRPKLKIPQRSVSISDPVWKADRNCFVASVTFEVIQEGVDELEHVACSLFVNDTEVARPPVRGLQVRETIPLAGTHPVVSVRLEWSHGARTFALGSVDLEAHMERMQASLEQRMVGGNRWPYGLLISILTLLTFIALMVWFLG
jgi:hypothetical protein